MNKRLVTLVLAIIMILSQTVVFAEDGNFSMQIVSGEIVVDLTLEELKALPEDAHIEDEYVYYSKTGEKKVQVKGISLEYILEEKANLKDEEGEVTFEALDGYPIDPQSLKDIFNDELKYVIAYEVGGEVVDEDENPETNDVIVYRKVKEANEFGTVFKMVYKITIDKVIAEETTVEEPVKDPVEELVEVNFADITEEFKFAESAIIELAKKGIIDGVGEGLYDPSSEFTRAQFCKIVVEALGYEQKEYVGGFNDVVENQWFAPYVQAALETGLFKGYEDGTFKPNQFINRQEMASVAGRAAVLAEVVKQEKMDKFVMEKSVYLDKDLVPEWAANEVAWLEAQNVFKGIASENFAPTKVVNRAEAALIVFNTLFQE